MATLTALTLAEPAFVTGAAAEIVTCPVDAVMYIRQIIVHNTDVAAQLVEIYHVPNNGGLVGTAVDEYRIFAQSVAADDTVFLTFGAPGIVFSALNDTLQAEAALTGVVTVSVSGFQEDA